MALFTPKIGTKRLLRLHLFVTGAPIWCYEIGVVGWWWRQPRAGARM